jgi:hypothetical protein
MEAFLLGTIILLIAIILFMAHKWPKVIEISDVAPEEDSPRNRWLKLQNEGGKYVQKENDRIKLKIVK